MPQLFSENQRPKVSKAAFEIMLETSQARQNAKQFPIPSKEAKKKLHEQLAATEEKRLDSNQSKEAILASAPFQPKEATDNASPGKSEGVIST